MNDSLAQLLKPKTKSPVRELLEAAKIDVTDWETDRHGSVLANPNAHVYNSFKWSFGGFGKPVALCIWHEEIDWTADPPVRIGNSKNQQEDLNALADAAISKGEKSRLGIKVRRTQDFQRAVQEAYSKRLAVHVLLLDGHRTEIEDAAKDSSSVSFRELDPVPWYVHQFDPYSGEYKLVRGLEPPLIPKHDPFAGIEDPGLEPSFQYFIESLGETERESLIKARVGQGPFREALVQRWGGCSVTGCGAVDLLIASHIKPWSLCITAAERLGAANGLLLTPSLDKLFDRGLITFDQKFRIRIRPQLKPGVQSQFGVDGGLRLRSDKAGSDLLPFLQWHEEHLFTRPVMT